MAKDIYTDGVMNIGFGQGAVRIDFGRIGNVSDGEKPQLEYAQRVVMTPEGFAQALAAMNAMAKQMAENGVLKIRDAGNGDTPQKVKSVNFS